MDDGWTLLRCKTGYFLVYIMASYVEFDGGESRPRSGPETKSYGELGIANVFMGGKTDKSSMQVTEDSIKEGWLVKKARNKMWYEVSVPFVTKVWQNRLFKVFKNKTLIYYDEVGHIKGDFNLTKKGVKIIKTPPTESGPHSFCFSLCTHDKKDVLTCAANSEEERTEWIDFLHYVQSDCYISKPFTLKLEKLLGLDKDSVTYSVPLSGNLEALQKWGAGKQDDQLDNIFQCRYMGAIYTGIVNCIKDDSAFASKWRQFVTSNQIIIRPRANSEFKKFALINRGFKRYITDSGILFLEYDKLLEDVEHIMDAFKFPDEEGYTGQESDEDGDD